jgi:hypothetical protein
MANVKIQSGGLLGLASIACGAYLGYMNAQGIPIEKKNLECALTYGPTIIQAGLFGAVGAIGGLIAGAGAGISGSRKPIYGAVGGGVIGTAAGAVAIGAIGAVAGAVETAIGYGIGYFAGWAMK